MRSHRRIACAVVLVAAASTAGAVASPGSWVAVAPLEVPRSSATATTLSDGRVLVVGGQQGRESLASAEMFDPAAGQWSTVAPMSSKRRGHAAVLLPDDRVLVSGGWNGSATLDSVEVFDPASGSWTTTDPLVWPRFAHQMTALADGRILLTGGFSSALCPAGANAHTEIYDPQTGIWAEHGWLSVSRAHHTADLLAGGRVLLMGGTYDERGDYRSGYGPELYDPATGVSELATQESFGRLGHTSTVLPDGRVLVVGGCCLLLPGVPSYNLPTEEFGALQASIFDPGSNTWTTTQPMRSARAWHTATLLHDGRVLVAGGVAIKPGTQLIGARADEPVAEAEVYDPASDAWLPAGTLSTSRSDHLAAVVGDDVIVIGGVTGSTPVATVERFTGQTDGAPLPGAQLPTDQGPPTMDPGTDEPRFREGYWHTSDELVAARSRHAAVALADGKILIAGGMGDGAYPSELKTAEVFDPAARTWSATGSMQAPRWGHSLSLLNDGRVLVTGRPGFGGPASEIYSPSAGIWSATEPMRAPRANHTATVLADGRVLVAGGYHASPDCYAPTQRAEIFDPPSGKWTEAAMMNVPRLGHRATLLVDGRVLVTGGTYESTAEIYDPALDRWTFTRRMVVTRSHHSSHTLPDGRVLVVGGCCIPRFPLVADQPVPNELTPSPAEIYDPGSNTWALTAPMSVPRYAHSATTLRDGSILVAGGFTSAGYAFECGWCETASAEIYEPVTGTWRPTQDLLVPRANHVAAMLANGSVVVTGGVSGFNAQRPNGSALPFTDIFDLV